jgi:hypothetical protein
MSTYIGTYDAHSAKIFDGQAVSVTDVMIFLNIFDKQIGKNGVFCSNYGQFLQKFDHNNGFREKRQFFAENWQKSQKIGIITSTPVLT